jgi:hypothetical protein
MLLSLSTFSIAGPLSTQPFLVITYASLVAESIYWPQNNLVDLQLSSLKRMPEEKSLLDKSHIIWVG